jgi:hypothetical protein
LAALTNLSGQASRGYRPHRGEVVAVLLSAADVATVCLRGKGYDDADNPAPRGGITDHVRGRRPLGVALTAVTVISPFLGTS